MKIAALLFTLVAMPAAAATPTTSPIPPARAESFRETVFGVSIDDPYRWMESAANKPEMEAWLRQGSAASVAVMAALPEHDAFARIVDEAMRAGVRFTDATAAGDVLFYRRQDPADRTSKLVVRQGGVERVLFDPEKGASGVTAMGGYSVSPDGAVVAVQSASNGAEVGQFRFLKVGDGSDLGVPLGPSQGEIELAWLKNGSVAYSRMAAPGTTPDPIQNMHFMVARFGFAPGTAVLGAGVAGAPPFTPVEIPVLTTSPTSDWGLGMAVGARSDARVFVARIDGLTAGKPDWRPLADYADQAMDAAVIGDDAYLLTSLGAPNGKVVRQRIGGASETVLPESDLVLEHVTAARDGLYVAGVRDGVDHIVFLPAGRSPARDVTLPIDGFLPSLRTNRDGSSVIFSLSGWTTETAIYEARAGKATPLGLASSS